MEPHETELLRLRDKMPEMLLSSKSGSTVSKYQSYYLRFKKFMLSHDKRCLPARGADVALFFVHLLDCKVSHNVVLSYACAIKWMHELCNYPSPTCSSLVKNLIESSKRSVQKPKVRKDAISPEIIKSLCLKYSDSEDLAIARDIAMIVFSFIGFLRYDELSRLKCNSIVFCDSYVKVHIEQSKTDQYRDGSEVLLAKIPSPACPVRALRRYVTLAGLEMSSNDFLFRAIYRSGDKVGLRTKNVKLSYTRTKEVLLSRLREVAPDGLNLGLHSLRAGGASAAANAGVNDRCWRRHGRWRSDAANGYIKDSVNNRLQVSKSLGL